MRFYLTMVLVLLLGGCSLVLWAVSAQANDLNFGFKNPSFHSGNGYSSHVLSMEQLRFTRKKERKEKIEAAAAQAIRDEKNNTVAKFLVNVESRIYAQLSKQLVDNMFGEECEGTCPTSGTAEVEGSTIYWVKDTTTEIITLTITSPDGSTTTMSVPVGDFKF